MRYINRFALVMLLALALSVGAARGASAQGSDPWGLDVPDPGSVGAQGVAGEGEVEKTFELTLVGDVPEGELALVFFETDDPAVPGGVIVFCGPEEFGGSQPCEAGTYTSDPVTLAAGTSVAFIFAAGDPEADEPTFTEEGLETLTEDMVNEAVFDYGGDDQQDGDEQDGGDTLPDTGGAMPVGLPLGGVPAALGLGAAAVAVLRRR